MDTDYKSALSELLFRITFSTKQKIERLRNFHHLKVAERYAIYLTINSDEHIFKFTFPFNLQN
jgi:hypothetical protein